MAEFDPSAPTRRELAKIFPNQRTLRAFEKIFDLLPLDLNTINQYISETKLQPISVSSDYTVQIGNYLILVDASSGAKTITIPDATEAIITYDASATIAVGKIDTSSNAVNIVPSVAGQLIVGEASQSLIADGEILNFAAYNGNWELAS